MWLEDIDLGNDLDELEMVLGANDRGLLKAKFFFFHCHKIEVISVRVS